MTVEHSISLSKLTRVHGGEQVLAPMGGLFQHAACKEIVGILFKIKNQSQSVQSTDSQNAIKDPNNVTFVSLLFTLFLAGNIIVNAQS